MINTIGLGFGQGFSITAAVAFTNPNTATLESSLDEEEVLLITFYILSVSIIIIPTIIFMPISGPVGVAEMIGRKKNIDY